MKHCIIIKFKEDVNWNNLIDDIKKLFERAMIIDDINDVCINISNSELKNRYDMMIEIECTKKGLLNFDNSEIHTLWKLKYGELIQNKVIFDYDT